MKRRTAWPITLLVLLVASVLAAPTVAAADTTPPSAPYFVSVKDVTETSVRVYWGPATDENGIETYVVYRDGQPLYEQPGNVHRAWTDGTVQPGTTYLYEVRAIDPYDNVGPPNDELVTTPGEPGPPPPPSATRRSGQRSSQSPASTTGRCRTASSGTPPTRSGATAAVSFATSGPSCARCFPTRGSLLKRGADV